MTAAASIATRIISQKELKAHNTYDDCWIALHGVVYDCTHYLKDHPGGDQVIEQTAGRDATSEFEEVGHSISARRMCEKLRLGILEGWEDKALGAMGNRGKSAGQSGTSLFCPENTPRQILFALSLGVAIAVSGYFFIRYV